MAGLAGCRPAPDLSSVQRWQREGLAERYFVGAVEDLLPRGDETFIDAPFIAAQKTASFPSGLDAGVTRNGITGDILVHHSALHNEHNPANRSDVFQRISVKRDDVGL